MRWIVFAAVAALALGGNACAQDEQVPFVGCPSDGQLGPQPAPSNDQSAPTLPEGIASRLAFYVSNDTGGVLAPRGWRCIALEGSNGSILLIKPGSFGRDPLSTSLSGPAIQLSVSLAETSGRFEAARIAARLFPAHRAFVDGVIAEGFEPRSDFPSGPPAHDRIQRAGPNVVTFETPANEDGVGTMTRLRKSPDPISGRASIDDDNNVTLLAIRLDPSMRDLAPAILGGGQASAGSVVSAFYNALSRGDGAAAAGMVVTEKRAGPFSAESLTRFYTRMREPLRLIEVEKRGPSTFIAHYSYSAGKTACDGRAEVTITQRQGQSYIAGVKALNGC